MRPQVPEDAEAVLAFDGLPEVRRFLNRSRGMELADARQRFTEDLEKFRRGEAYYLALEELGSGELVGTLGIRFFRHPLQANLGYTLAPGSWGQGLATEAVAAATALAFEDCHANRVEASVQVGNVASRRVLEKCGFACDGTLRASTLANGEWRDEWFMTRLRTEWEAEGRPGLPRRIVGRLGQAPPPA
jgi:RimJ/RimL family protein N-acetyltransferase